ncbi:hypothetical protein LR48_Vigan01g173300 [Vigna angularis]|uniref:Transcription factor n=1 Tax=Phaseolus angularis TaxID=3914 RepID=A0A0L9TNZ8_PHAAN|nr:Transcription factor [Vigna angularis]KOM32177.1 hypothetical protein LR48_Vigan01g173300 [Vigna angularis]
MSQSEEDWCEELTKAIEANSTLLDQWWVDVKCPEELCNLQGQSLPQQNLSDSPPIQHNANMTNVESALIPLLNNPLNTQSQKCDPPVQRRQRKPRITWTVKEHELFLWGIKKYGMSWKMISKEIVRTKTPSQLASHAQKYFERQKIPPSERKRKSIHDITLPLSVNPRPAPAQVTVPFNVHPPRGQVNGSLNVQSPLTPDFSMQNIHPLVYALAQNSYMQNILPAQNSYMQDILPAQNSYMQDILTANVDPLAYTPLQDIYKQNIQGQQQMPPFSSPYYNIYN